MTEFDLREAFARSRSFRSSMPADDDGTDDNAGGEDEGQEQEDDTESDNDNPRIKQLSDEATKYRRERNEARRQLDELKGKGGKSDDSETVRRLRLELSFERLATKAKISDIEAAWRLVEDDLKAVKVEDDRVDAERLQQIVDHVVERYPYLRDDYAPQKDKDTEGDPSSSPSDTSTNATSGRPINGRRRSDTGLDARTLTAKFPALTRR